MSRRNHTTDLGCVACDDLGELGAGKEGWLADNPSLLCALDTHALGEPGRTPSTGSVLAAPVTAATSTAHT